MKTGGWRIRPVQQYIGGIISYNSVIHFILPYFICIIETTIQKFFFWGVETNYNERKKMSATLNETSKCNLKPPT